MSNSILQGISHEVSFLGGVKNINNKRLKR